MTVAGPAPAPATASPFLTVTAVIGGLLLLYYGGRVLETLLAVFGLLTHDPPQMVRREAVQTARADLGDDAEPGEQVDADAVVVERPTAERLARADRGSEET